MCVRPAWFDDERFSNINALDVKWRKYLCGEDLKMSVPNAITEEEWKRNWEEGKRAL